MYSFCSGSTSADGVLTIARGSNAAGPVLSAAGKLTLEAPNIVQGGTLKAPMGAAAAGQVSPLRKKFRGRLSRAEAGGWQIVWSDEPAAKPGQKISKKRAPAPLQVLGFTLDELREARLAPIVDFKGRGAASGRCPGRLAGYG